MSKFKNIKVGDILSENSFYEVTKVNSDHIEATVNGQTVRIQQQYVDDILDSAHFSDKTEKVTATVMANILLSNQRTAMTVEFYTKDKPKTKKQQKADLVTAQMAVLNGDDIATVIDKVLPFVKGTLRVMTGYHTGNMNEHGRLVFNDLKATDGRTRQVDPRTIQSIVVNNVKYVLK